MISAQGGQIVPFPAQASDKATLIQNDKVRLINLGSQIRVLVEQYNEMWRNLQALPGATKAQFMALFDQRKSAMQTLVTAHQTAIADLRHEAQQSGVSIDISTPPANLSGLGQLVDTSTIQTQITQEQAKLEALQNYYTAYQSALSAGQQPPAVPPELQGGMLGISGTGIAIGIAAIVGAMLFFKGK